MKLKDNMKEYIMSDDAYDSLLKIDKLLSLMIKSPTRSSWEKIVVEQVKIITLKSKMTTFDGYYISLPTVVVIEDAAFTINELIRRTYHMDSNYVLNYILTKMKNIVVLGTNIKKQDMITLNKIYRRMKNDKD